MTSKSETEQFWEDRLLEIDLRSVQALKKDVPYLSPKAMYYFNTTGSEAQSSIRAQNPYNKSLPFYGF